MPEGGLLTRHHALAPRWYGYTARDWYKLYGFFAAMLSLLAFTYIRYFQLFDDISSQSAAYKLFTIFVAGGVIVILLPAILSFFWWASFALVRYSKWQLAQPVFWRWFWMVVLLFYFYVEFDPLDNIHPGMSSRGVAPAPNLLLLFDGRFELMQFQWGYFLLWFLFWFLVAALHWQYFVDSLRDVWFFSSRVHRYSASVLTGFRETVRTQNTPAATVRWGYDEHEHLAQSRQRPYLNVASLTEAQAAAIIAADHSSAIQAAPGQPTVLFVDLGAFWFSTGLETLTDDGAVPLLAFSDEPVTAAASREDLVVPLKPHVEGNLVFAQRTDELDNRGDHKDRPHTGEAAP